MAPRLVNFLCPAATNQSQPASDRTRPPLDNTSSSSPLSLSRPGQRPQTWASQTPAPSLSTWGWPVSQAGAPTPQTTHNYTLFMAIYIICV